MKQKIFVPRKLKGGSQVGKEGETWFAVKVTGLSPVEIRAFKKYLGASCKDFFTQEEEVVDNY